MNTYTEKMMFYLHRTSDGALSLKAGDMSNYSWAGQCVHTVELDLTIELPSEQDMLLAAKATFERHIETERAKAAESLLGFEQTIAKIRESQQKYFALPSPIKVLEIQDDLLPEDPSIPEDDMPF